MKALSSHRSWRDASFAFWLLVTFLGLTFLTGGSARLDVQSLPLLRPASILVCGIALWNVRWSHLQSHKFISSFILSAIALTTAHLIPLSPNIWILLPGRQIQADIGIIAGITTAWWPLSFAPEATLDSLLSLTTPLAVFLLGVQINRHELTQLLKVVVLLGASSAALGLLQLTGDREGSLYLYEVTNNGSAVGLFANRNHQALLLSMLFPMLGVYASTAARFTEETRLKVGVLIAMTVVLIPLLLITGSRAGLLAGTCGLIFMILIYRNAEPSPAYKAKPKKFHFQYISGTLVIASLIFLTFFMSRADSIYRLMGNWQSEDLRFKILGPILVMSREQFPFGSGIGSFSTFYKSQESHDLLIPYYFNQSHNDFLDIFLTAGFFGLGLIVAALFGWMQAALTIYRQRHNSHIEITFRKLGIICAGLIIGCSSADYPLRTPIFGALLVICALWAQMGVRQAVRAPRNLTDESQTF